MFDRAWLTPPVPIQERVIPEPEGDDWLQAYLRRGWERIDVDGQPMLKYPDDMGVPLHPADASW